jgi:hypothetical protein
MRAAEAQLPERAPGPHALASRARLKHAKDHALLSLLPALEPGYGQS